MEAQVPGPEATHANHPDRATAVAAAICLNPRPSQAYEGPWCALTDVGGGVMHENCSVRTFEMCVQEVIAGNRRFCNPTRRWQGPAGGPGDRAPAKARRLLTDAVAPPRTKALPPKSSAAGLLAGTNEAALMKIFPGRLRKCASGARLPL